MPVLYLLMALALAAVHVFAGSLRFLQVTPRSRWLSLGGGVAVAYVFVRILPELSKAQTALGRLAFLQFLDRHVYLVALAGLTAFYGLERAARISRRRSCRANAGDVTDVAVFRLHVASYGAYNLLIGYLLLHREEPGLDDALVFSVAMALHFLSNDYGLRCHHQERYDRLGRWLLGASVLAGAAIGAVWALHEAAVAALFAFLAGGIILNVLKEELPEERHSRFGPFAAGATLYTLLLLAVR